MYSTRHDLLRVAGVAGCLLDARKQIPEGSTLALAGRAPPQSHPLDDHRECYRYHHLFEDMLRHKLNQSDAETIPALNRRAADW